LRALDRLDRYENAAAEPSQFDEEEDSASKLDAGLDRRVRMAAGDKAHAAAAARGGGRTAARRRPPRGFILPANL
jgi:hypothetical protein